MATNYTGNPVIDPDAIGYEVNAASYIAGTEELLIDTTAKTLALKVVEAGTLTTDGITLKAVYSKLKDAWKADATLIKFPFPMGPITDEQFELINGWNWDKTGSSGITISTAAFSASPNTITYTTSSDHGLGTGDIVTIAGVTPVGYNGTYVIDDVPSSTTFTVLEDTDPTTYTSGGTVANYLATPELLRTGGWTVLNGAGDVTESWAGIITLGALGTNDQVYFLQNTVPEATSTDFKLFGPVNQAVQIIDDPNGDGNYSDGFSWQSFLTVYVREWEKTYAQSSISDIGVATLASQAYRFPLTNSTDLKITVTAANIPTELDANEDGDPDIGVYANTDITYLRDANGDLFDILGDAVVGSYAVGDVVKDGAGRWYNCTSAGTVDATDISDLGAMGGAGTATFSSYTGERLVGTVYYAYNIIIDADTNVGPTSSGVARTTEIYTAVQQRLRYNIDIDTSSGYVQGKTADPLLNFVGDTLVTTTGVYIDSFNSQDTNAITFTDGLGVGQTFPFVAALTINFGTFLQTDANAEYWIFFTSGTAGQYGEANAIIVQDSTGNNMAGSVSAASSANYSYNYDSNDQRDGGTYNGNSGASKGTDAPITGVAIGLVTGQYVSATSTIGRSTGNSITLTAARERNYTD